MLEQELPDTARAVVMAELSMQLGAKNIDSSQLLAEKAVQLANETGYMRAKMMAQNALGNYYLKKNDFYHAEKTLLHALQFADSLKDPKNQGIIYHSMGVIFHYQGEYDKALSYYQIAERIRKENNDPVGLALTYNNIAIIYKQQANYSKALEYFFDIQKTLEFLGKQNTENYGNTFNGIGSIYFIQKDYKKALDYYKQALSIYEKNGYQQKVALAYNNVGEVYKVLGKYREAVAMQLMNFELSTRIGSKVNITFACHDLGIAYLAMGKPDSARYYLDQGMRAALSINSPERMASIKAVYADYYFHVGKYAQAFQTSGEALALADSIKSIEIAREALGYRYKAAKALGKNEEALASYERFIALRDSMANEQQVKTLMSKDFEAQEEKRKLEQQAKEIAFQATLEQQALVRNALIVGLVLLSGFIVVVYRSYQRKQRDNKMLSEQKVAIAEKNVELAAQRDQVEYAYEHIRLMSEIGKIIASKISIDEILAEVYQNLNKIMDAEGFGIGLYNEAENRIDFPSFWEKGRKLPFQYHLLDDERRISAWCFRHQEIVWMNDIATDYSKYIPNVPPPVQGENPRSVVYYPLTTQRRIGVISIQSFQTHAYNDFHINMLKGLAAYIGPALENAKAVESIEYERTKNEELLLNILPKQTAEELKIHGKSIPKLYEHVSVLFADFVGFTHIAEKLSPERLVEELDGIFHAFDEIMKVYGLEKIKTIGDAYMAAAGVPMPHKQHALACVQAGMAMQEFIAEKNRKDSTIDWHLRIGIHSGSVTAGVVGKHKFAYDIWGDAVNVAARMEQGGEPDRVNISESTYNLVRQAYHCTYRGELPAKNKGSVRMYFVQQAL